MDVSGYFKRAKRHVKDKLRGGGDPVPNQASSSSTLTVPGSGNTPVSTTPSASPLIQSMGHTTSLANTSTSTPILPAITPPPGTTSVSATGQASTPILITGTPNPSNSTSTPKPYQAPRASNTAWSGLKTLLNLLNASADAFGPLKSAVGGLVKCIDIYESAAQGRKDYETLRIELDSLFDTLVRRFDGPMPPQMTASIASLSNGIQKEVDLVHQKCDRTTMERLAEAIEDQEDVLNCYRRIQRLLSQISMNANLEMWKILDMQLAETRLRGMRISEAARYNSSESTGMLRGKCTPNTRRTVIGGLHAWVDDPDRVSVYWLNGMAGTGKTTIAYSFCAEREEIQSLGASFFCSRTSASCNDATLIVPTIAYQLALFSYPFRSVLCKLLGEELDICNRDVTTQFQRMIVDTLAKTRDSLPRNTVVVIDALDECSNQQDVRIFLEALLEHGTQLPLKIFVSSRAEGAVHSQMMRNPARRSVFYLHEVEESFVREDIELYVKSELEPISPSLDQISQLAEQAGKLFIYAATVIRYVKRDEFDDYSLDRLDSLLQLHEANDDIDELYTRILASAFNKPRLGEQEKVDMLEVLHAAICTREPLTIHTLGALLRPNRPMVVRTALQPFHSVLHVSQTNDLVTVLHASFPDYLFSQQRAGKFYCNKEQQNARLACLCFELIGAVNPSFNICALESSYVLDSEVPDLMKRIERAIPPETFYSCRYGFAHVEMSNNPEELKTLVGNFLSSRLLLWMEIMNLKKCMNVGAQLLSRAQQWYQKYGHNDALLELLQDAYNFALMFASSPASLCTPHIYMSMLMFWSPYAPVSVHYRKCVRGMVHVSGSALASGNSPLLAKWPAHQSILDLAISPDNMHFAIISLTNGISILDAYTGQKVLGPLENTDIARRIAYSPCGTHIVCDGPQRKFWIWDVRNGKNIMELFGGFEEGLSVLTYSPDGTRIVASSYFGTILRVWDASDGRVIHTLQWHVCNIRSLACSPDCATVASGHEDGKISIWDLGSGHLLHSLLACPGDRLGSVVYSPNGTRIACETEGKIYVLDAHTGQILLGPLECGSRGTGQITYSPDGTRIGFCARDTAAIYIWDADSGRSISGPLMGHVPPTYERTGPYPSYKVAYSPDGSRIISSMSWDSTICVWNARVEAEWNTPTEGHTGSVASVFFSPDGTQIISGSDDKTVCVWDARSGRRLVGPLEGHEYKVLSVACSHDGSHIISISYEGTLIIWDARTRQRKFGPVGGFSDVQAVAYSAHGSPLIISGSRGPTIRVWDSHSMKLVLEMSENRFESVDSIACSPDGAYIVSSYYRTIHVWDVPKKKLALSLQGHQDEIRSVAYSSDGKYIVSGSSDTTVCIWNAQDGRMEVGPIKGHTTSVNVVAYSPDGAHVASGSLDGTICVWDSRTGDMVVGPLRAHHTSINSIAYSPDSALIAAAASDGTVRVWCPDQLLQGAQAAWELNEDGWMINALSHRLVWVPPDLRDKLLAAGEVLRISTQNSFTVTFDGAYLGHSWIDTNVTP